MDIYNYEATNKEGKPQSGSLEATDRDSALSQLAKQGLLPSKLKKQGGFDPKHIKIPFLSRKKVKTKDLVVFTRQLSTMVNAGVALVRALITLRDQTENETFQKVLAELAKDVESGQTLADGMAKHPNVFSPIYTNMVAAGEAGGILDDILKRLALQQEKDSSIKKKVRSASAYPAVLMVITILAFFALMIFVVPRIGRILTELGGEDAELPIYTTLMLGASDIMVTYWYLIFSALGVGIYLLRRYIKTPAGKKKFHQFLLKVPVIKTVIVKVVIARFSRTFASLMGAGVGVLDTIEITARALGNKVIEDELIAAAQEVKNGQQLSTALASSAVFPPIVSQMLAVGEETGEIDTVLVKVADFYEEEVDSVIESLSSIIEPVMIVVMGGMVGIIALSVMGPLTSITQNIQ